MKKVPAYLFIGLATVLFGYAMPANEAERFGNTATTATVSSAPGNIKALSVEYINKAIEIRWEADTEQNSKQFEVQRSEDGKIFKTVGLVFTMEDDDFPLKYNFKDPLKGVSTQKLFYRIKQTSIDEQHQYSDVVATALQKKKV